jgi:hypothetical protein
MPTSTSCAILAAGSQPLASLYTEKIHVNDVMCIYRDACWPLCQAGQSADLTKTRRYVDVLRHCTAAI